MLVENILWAQVLVAQLILAAESIGLTKYIWPTNIIERRIMGFPIIVGEIILGKAIYLYDKYSCQAYIWCTILFGPIIVGIEPTIVTQLLVSIVISARL